MYKNKIDRTEITPEHLYLSRRKFIKSLGALAATAAFAAACAPAISPTASGQASQPSPTPGTTNAVPTATMPQPTETPVPTVAATPVPFPTLSATEDELGDELTEEEAIDNYNNYYEFSLAKEAVASRAKDFVTSPWQVEVTGLVQKPKTFSMGELLAYPQEERIYRLRCVEAWSMVIPWIGFPLARVLEEVEPTSQAQYVRFTTVYRPEQMPGQQDAMFDWPYFEGLRLDEAMHDLTILATGLYAKPLEPQTGAPIRLVVPWKYGFKSIKSIVRIELVEEMPKTFWKSRAPAEYGFYANVNPNVSHPRWSQATERRIGELGRRETLMFNGYEEEVASLYEGMDLRKWF
jgi:sulfoxide reductase catalytic subunit YedY